MIPRRNVITLLAVSASVLVHGLALAQVPATPEKLPVVATFSVLGDLVREIGGERVALTTLVEAGGDAHVYSPTPRDAKSVSEARVVITNGLGFEGWLDRLVKSTATRAVVVEASKGIKTLTIPGAAEKAHGDGAKDKHGHDHRGKADPHAWQDVANVKRYVANIRDALIAADPTGKDSYETRATAYLAGLDALDSEIRSAITRLPASQRKIVTSHDAFGYFARAYGLTFIAPRGVSTEAEVSPKDVAAIIRQIRREKIAAVFIEQVKDERLARQIAAESGAKIGGVLFADTLSAADGPAPTYLAMMRHNVRMLVAALTPGS